MTFRLHRHFYLAFFAILALATGAFAHPHVFADVVVQAVFDNSGLIGVQNHWEYDEVYGMAMYAAADKDNNGRLSDSELAQLQKDVVETFKSSNYYNYVLYKSEFLGARGIQNFKAKLQKGKLVLDFLVTFSIPASNDYEIFVIVVTDPSNYILITADMENSSVKAPDAIDADYYNDSLEGLTMMRAFRSDIEGLYVRFKK